MSKLTCGKDCGECPHNEDCKHCQDVGDSECPARASERELLMVLEMVSEAFDFMWTRSSQSFLVQRRYREVKKEINDALGAT